MIKAVRNRVYPRAAADENALIFTMGVGGGEGGGGGGGEGGGVN